MNLKHYQDNKLAAVKAYFERCAFESPVAAYKTVTADAFKNVLHPYRQELDRQFEGRVKVFDLDEKFQILPEDIADNLCIVVSTVKRSSTRKPANTTSIGTMKISSRTLRGYHSRMAWRRWRMRLTWTLALPGCGKASAGIRKFGQKSNTKKNGNIFVTTPSARGLSSMRTIGRIRGG